MVRPIVRDVLFLSRRSEEAAQADLPLAADLRDTLAANAERCVGLAGNMLGLRKRVIAVNAGGLILVMFNPVITKKSGAYEAEEGCLSLDGQRRTVRYQRIEAEYRDEGWAARRGVFTGFTAQIIQHEVDHLNGILI